MRELNKYEKIKGTKGWDKSHRKIPVTGNYKGRKHQEDHIRMREKQCLEVIVIKYVNKRVANESYQDSLHVGISEIFVWLNIHNCLSFTAAYRIVELEFLLPFIHLKVCKDGLLNILVLS